MKNWLNRFHNYMMDTDPHPFVKNKKTSKDGIERNTLGYTKDKWNDLSNIDRKMLIYKRNREKYPVLYGISDIINDTLKAVKNALEL